MKRLAAVVWLLLLSSCLPAQTRPATASSSPEVILLGTAHDLHFKGESHYSLVDLRNEVEALHPDLICGEITPEAYQGPMEGYFPPEAAYLDEIAPTLNARFAAADWRIVRAWQRRAEELEPKEIQDKLDALTAEMARQMQLQSDPSLFDFLHTKALALADYQFEQVAGENTDSDIALGAWHERNRRIVENCLEAAADARRIVFVYGASHMPQLQRQLAARGITAQIAGRRFTPAGLGSVPPSVIARWQRNLDNLKRILDGSIAVSRDSLDKVRDSHRVQDLELALKTYSDRAGSTEPLQVTGYFVEEGAKSGHYLVKDFASSGAASMLTMLDYAFGRVVNRRCEIDNEETALKHAYRASEGVDGVADAASAGQLRGTFHQLQKLKQKHPGLKILISLGGWGGSDGFSNAVEPDHVREFVRSCVQKFILGRFAPGMEAPGIFDGIDIDWEYPVGGGLAPGRPEDKQGFTAMLAEFRRQLDAVRPGLLLTAALPAREADYRNFELEKISGYLDAVSLMAYDLHWNTEPMTNFHSAMFHDQADPSPAPLDKYYADQAVQAFLQAGVPPSKLVLGVPFYGKAWNQVSPENHGLYQAGKKGNDDSGSYRQLKALPASADRQYYPQVESCTVWHKRKFWSYDCPQALRAKMSYVREHSLGGVMFWELSQDTADSELLRALTGNR